MEVLVTGGLGFIGSHTVVCLAEAGYTPVIVDNLDNSDIKILNRLESICGFKPMFYECDIQDFNSLNSVFQNQKLQAVIHFAAHKAVGESVKEPLKYYKNNVGGMISLLETMKKHTVEHLVFSSSCTVYGEPDIVPVNEDAPIKAATSPYGATKQMCETILKDLPWCKTQCLRYFNPVGAHPTGLIGELPLGVPNNLVPYITQTAIGLRKELIVYGDDYPTKDGTCIRDYIHVMDLAEAHICALERLVQEKYLSGFEVFNIGTGTGCSVLEVVNSFMEVNKINLPYAIGDRREGDVVEVWADPGKSEKILGWKAKYGLTEMMKDAWNWQIMESKSGD